MMEETLFANIKEAPPIEVLDMKKRFDEDESTIKINLTVGGYKDERGQPYILPVVREVERVLLTEADHNHEYLPALGSCRANAAVIQLLLGSCEAVRSGRAFSVQSIGGTGPLRLGADFLRQQLGCISARYSDPTWINHRDIFLKAGFSDVCPYPYWDYQHNKLDFQGLLGCMRTCPERTVFVLHAQAHNPTGTDPGQDQWKIICRVMKQRKLIPFFDCAYQGWATGDLDKDAWAVRYFHQQGMEMFISQSFGKNLGLYGDRIGFLSLVLNDAQHVEAVRGQLTLILRPMYGNPCRSPAKIIEKILFDEERTNMWRQQLSCMVQRIKEVRSELRRLMTERCPDNDWSSLTDQVGMFWFSGLSPSQGHHLASLHVYMMPSNGRMSLCGLNKDNISYFADCLATVMNNK